jgi:ABC-type transport system involved in multi-copper enzyme maturation permease subunit
MLGPIFNREVLIIPRSQRFFLTRAGYGAILLVLIWTGWQIMIGWRTVYEVGILARFEQILFRALVLTQLLMMLFFAPIAAATSVAHEKDRRTFILMLMTDMADWEIILGKLGSSLLLITVLLAAGLPVLAISLLLGGISPSQLLQIELVTLATGIVGGSVGLIVANWRDRTFQSLALTVLAVVLGLAAIEVVGLIVPVQINNQPISAFLDPFRVTSMIMESTSSALLLPVTISFIIFALALALILNVSSIFMLRRWNPGRNEPREQREAPKAEELIEVDETVMDAAEYNSRLSDRLAQGLTTSAQADDSTGLAVPRRTHRRVTGSQREYRHAWNNPILWRESDSGDGSSRDSQPASNQCPRCDFADQRTRHWSPRPPTGYRTDSKTVHLWEALWGALQHQGNDSRTHHFDMDNGSHRQDWVGIGIVRDD